MSPASAAEFAKVVAAEAANGFADGVTQEAFNEKLAQLAQLNASMTSFYGMVGTAAGGPNSTAPSNPALDNGISNALQTGLVQTMMGRGGAPLGGVPVGMPSLAGPDDPLPAEGDPQAAQGGDAGTR
jgi:hypothetical protein